jgi:dCMP deaminase
VTRLSRLDYALALADVVKLRAACTRRQVGAVILDRDGRVGATGYNGTPAGSTHCTDGGCPRGAYGYDQIPGFLGNNGHPVACTALHAEINAAAWALTHDVDPASSLVAITCPPCPDCERRLRNDHWGAVAVRTVDGGDADVAGWGDWGPWTGADAPSRLIVG